MDQIDNHTAMLIAAFAAAMVIIATACWIVLDIRPKREQRRQDDYDQRRADYIQAVKDDAAERARLRPPPKGFTIAVTEMVGVASLIDAPASPTVDGSQTGVRSRGARRRGAGLGLATD